MAEKKVIKKDNLLISYIFGIFSLIFVSLGLGGIISIGINWLLFKNLYSTYDSFIILATNLMGNAYFIVISLITGIVGWRIQKKDKKNYAKVLNKTSLILNIVSLALMIILGAIILSKAFSIGI